MTDIAHAPSTSLQDSLIRQSAEFILSIQHEDGAIPWFTGGKLDPWDHTEAAMALSVAGEWQAAERAYDWLLRNQLDDGSWLAHYFADDASTVSTEPPLRETNFVAYVATGFWHHYRITGNKATLRRFFPCLQRAMDFVIRYQTEHGDIAWAVDVNGEARNDALVTACASIIRSLECAVLAAQTLAIDCEHWQAAGAKLSQALLHKPERFDRTWASKARFSMDWYYPILAGLYSVPAATERLEHRWHEFVETSLGCRCVSDEPWVTMAETSELVISLVAAGQEQKAQALFQTLAQWRDHDGGYWTGYVFRDKAIWPAEKTSWTAGAVLLAVDALYKLTPAHNLFTQPNKLAQR